MIRAISLLVLLSLLIQFKVWSNIVLADDSLKINIDALKKVRITELKIGQQGIVKSGIVKLDIGLGSTNSYLFGVPPIDRDSIKIILRSLVYKSQIYYPIIIKLSDSFEIQEIIKQKVSLEGSDLFGWGINNEIVLNKKTRYLLVTTDPQLKSKNFTHVYSQQNSTPVYSGSTMIVVPTNVSVNNISIRFTDNPKIIMSVPTRMYYRPFKREKGFYYGLGIYFGGDKVADNPSGDDYKAGSGAVFPIGYSHSIGNSNFVARYGIAIRYQGSQDGNSRNLGYFLDGIVSYQTRYVNFGTGLHYDFASSIRDLNGKVYKFDPVLSPKFVLEGRVKGIANMGFEYIIADFKSEGVNYNANRIGWFMRFFLGQ